MEQTNAEFQLEQVGTPVTTPNPVDSVGTTPVVQPDADVVAAAEAIRRKNQSELDKEAAGIAREYKEWKAKGNSGTVEQMLQQSQVIQPPIPQQIQAGSAQANTGPGAGEVTDPVIRKAFSIMETEGGKRLEASDPEFAIIDSKTDDPELFLASVHKAAEAYAKRTGNLSNPARIPTLAGGASPHTPNYANVPGVDILEEYNKAHPL